MSNKCKTCGFLNPQAPQCLLLGHQVDPAADYCSKYQSYVPTCELCNRLTVNSILEVSQPTVHTLCPDCCEKLSTCAGCLHADTCPFKTDPSPIPQLVQQTVRQGNATFVKTVMNPERIAITCKTNCECFAEDVGCCKQILQMCDNYSYIWQEEKEEEVCEDANTETASTPIVEENADSQTNS